MSEVVVSNREIYEKCQEILDVVKELNGTEIEKLNELESKIENILDELKGIVDQLDKIYSGIKTLSDNQVVIDDKIRSVGDVLAVVKHEVDSLQVLLPGK